MAFDIKRFKPSIYIDSGEAGPVRFLFEIKFFAEGLTNGRRYSNFRRLFDNKFKGLRDFVGIGREINNSFR